MDLWTAAASHFRYRITDSTVEWETGNDAMTKGPTLSDDTTTVTVVSEPLYTDGTVVLRWNKYFLRIDNNDNNDEARRTNSVDTRLQSAAD